MYKVEILNKRDRYMIGDWVLVDGKPHKWDWSDYNRSQMGMKRVEDIPLTKGILFDNGFYDTGSGFFKNRNDNRLAIYYENYNIIDKRKADGSYDWDCSEWSVMGISGIKVVSEYQMYLRLISRYEFADSFKIQ